MRQTDAVQPSSPSSPFHRGPSITWYVIGGLIIAAAIAAGIGVIVDAVADDDFGVTPIHGRVEVPGEGTVRLPEPGGYTLYWEPEPQPFDADDISAPLLDVFVQEADTGNPLPTHDYDGRFTYSSNGRRGLALRTFRSDDGGDVLVTAAGPPGLTGAIAVGEGIDLSNFAQIAAGFGVGFVGTALGGGVVGITAYRRFRARHPKVLTPGQWAAAPPPPPPPHA